MSSRIVLPLETALPPSFRSRVLKEDGSFEEVTITTSKDDVSTLMEIHSTNGSVSEATPSHTSVAAIYLPSAPAGLTRGIYSNCKADQVEFPAALLKRIRAIPNRTKVAKLVGVHPTTLYRILSGKKKFGDKKLVKQLRVVAKMAS